MTESLASTIAHDCTEPAADFALQLDATCRVRVIRNFLAADEAALMLRKVYSSKKIQKKWDVTKEGLVATEIVVRQASECHFQAIFRCWTEVSWDTRARPQVPVDCGDTLREVGTRKSAGMQGVAGSCRELQGVAVCCSVMQDVAECVAVRYSVFQSGVVRLGRASLHIFSVVQYVAVCCRVLRGGVACCSVSQCGTVWCGAVRCGAICCSGLQGVAVWCSVLQWGRLAKVCRCFLIRHLLSYVCMYVYTYICCSVMQCVAVCCSEVGSPKSTEVFSIQLHPSYVCIYIFAYICCSALQCVAAICSVSQSFVLKSTCKDYRFFLDSAESSILCLYVYIYI